MFPARRARTVALIRHDLDLLPFVSCFVVGQDQALNSLRICGHSCFPVHPAFVLFDCSYCCGCNLPQDAAFKPADSSTYEAIPCTSSICNTGVCGYNKQCKYERQYAESSTSAGVLGKDMFAFGDGTGLGSPRLLFGCENDETGDLFYQKADGIMGLGRGPLSIVDQLVKEKDMADTFSLCYGGMDEQGGNMIMGDFPQPPGMLFTASDPKRR